jgi:hypothetical protein
MRNTLTTVSVAVLVLAASAFTVQAAKKPEDVFGGRVMVSDKPFPLEAKSPAAYVAQVKKQSKDRFQEDKEKQQWKFYYAAFFKKPLNDLEVKVTIYDVTSGSQRFIDSWEEFLTERGQRVITGNVKLRRQDGKVNPNSKLLMIFESKGRMVATASFYIVGEGKKFTGKVEFSDEETKESDGEKQADPDAEAAERAKQK